MKQAILEESGGLFVWDYQEDLVLEVGDEVLIKKPSGYQIVKVHELVTWGHYKTQAYEASGEIAYKVEPSIALSNKRVRCEVYDIHLGVNLTYSAPVDLNLKSGDLCLVKSPRGFLHPMEVRRVATVPHCRFDKTAIQRRLSK